MKNPLSPAVVVAILVVVVVVLGLIGWRYLGGSRQGSGSNPYERAPAGARIPASARGTVSGGSMGSGGPMSGGPTSGGPTSGGAPAPQGGTGQ